MEKSTPFTKKYVQMWGIQPPLASIGIEKKWKTITKLSNKELLTSFPGLLEKFTADDPTHKMEAELYKHLQNI